MEPGFSVDLGELDAVGTILAEVALAITTTADGVGAQAPEAGASRDETAAVLRGLATRVRAVAGQVGWRADALTASAAAYGETDGAARRNLTGG